MKTPSCTTDRLARLGGRPVFATPPNPPWPPRNKTTEAALVAMYRRGHWSWNGPWEQQFCRTFSKLHTARHAVLMVNGTVTLEAALHVLGVGPGDEVIVPALTWLATAAAVVYVGAKPVFVDIEPDTLCLDPALVAAAITPRTKAMIPVHLYGGMADLDRLLALARTHHLKVIEDCAHGQGGQWNGRGLGSLGDIGSFSFQQSKAVSSGEGGCVVTNDERLAKRLFRYKNIGYDLNSKRGEAGSGPPPGLLCHNYRGTEFQAAVLQGQLGNLPAMIRQRNRRADFLTREMEKIPGVKIQARGRRATRGRQSYYAFTPILDLTQWNGATIGRVQWALQAEGLEVWPTYGSVYRHILWNVPPAKYRIHGGYRDRRGPGCRVSEEVGSARALGFPHYYLDLPESHLQKLVEALAKVQRHSAALGKPR